MFIPYILCKVCIIFAGILNLRGTEDQLNYFYPFSSSSTMSWAGLVIETNSRTAGVSISNVVINGSDVGLRIQHIGDVSINNCRFSNNNKGVEVLSEYANVIISDSLFHSNNYGIDLVDRGTFAIRGCQFTQQYESAIHGSTNRSRPQPETMSILNNIFAENRGSIDLSLSHRTSLRLVKNKFENETAPMFACIKLRVWNSNVTVEGNEFLRMKSDAMLIVANESANIITIRNNTWKYGINPLRIYYAGGYGPRTIDNTTTIENNVFYANDGALSLYYNGSTVVIIRLNEFTENTGKAVIFTWTEDAIPFEVCSNNFSMNSVNVGVIHASEPCEIHYNSFSNPNSSHDLVLGDVYNSGQTGSGGRGGVTNATYNWWGVANRGGVVKRIRIIDSPRLAVKHTVLWEPFLAHDPLMSCADMANCSNHGVCVGANTCRCEDGWLAPNCSQASCAKLNNCHGRGKCVAPNR